MSVKLITHRLMDSLVENMQHAQSICMLTAFAMASGVRLMAPYLQDAVRSGAEVKILVGDYLYVTQPSGLKALLEINENIEVRLWRSYGTSFHPKSYLFDYEERDGLFIVGSSNLSKSALTNGTEWNLSMNASVALETFEEARMKFLTLFYHEQTVPLNVETCRNYEQEYEEYHTAHPQLARSWAAQEEMEVMFSDEGDVTVEEDVNKPLVKEATATYDAITPRLAQQMALEELEKTRAEGYKKAMVVMATGLGKTYLAGFFAKNFRRVLFVAHREELLMQASHSFRQVMPDRTVGIYNGSTKDVGADTVFASIFTLGVKKHLECFEPAEFDLIIIDEFHHAAAQTYSRLLGYFQPSFLLGITATPDRADGKDIYAICEGNVAFQIGFIEAVQRGWLAPFRYFGVYDDTDYSQIRWLGNRYDEEALLIAQLKEEVAQKAFAAWAKHKQTRTLAFCSSIRQASFLADFFKQRGVHAFSLHSQTKEMTRAEAIRRLAEGSLEILFTVDLFNEGVDIPAVDTLLFVRPTESLTVFTQQVGRGLRLFSTKEYCSIIDLIGNYRNADIKMSLFDTEEKEAKKKTPASLPVVPANCEIHFDIGVIDLFREMSLKRQPRKEKLLHAFLKLKMELGRIPTYLELHLHGRENSRDYKQEFKSYVGFLDWANQLSEEEKEVLQEYQAWIQEVESTNMTKSYKMVVLLYMLERGEGDWSKPLTPQEAAPFFHQYFMEKEYRKNVDFSDGSSKKLWDYDEDKVSKLIADMPMTKWSGSSTGLISFINGVFSLSFGINEKDSPTLYRWTREICLYRLNVYFERKTPSS